MEFTLEMPSPHVPTEKESWGELADEGEVKVSAPAAGSHVSQRARSAGASSRELRYRDT